MLRFIDDQRTGAKTMGTTLVRATGLLARRGQVKSPIINRVTALECWGDWRDVNRSSL